MGKIYVVGPFPHGFKIRSLLDAENFAGYLPADEHIDIPDADDKTLYHRICRSKDGTVTLGSAHYGRDPITAEIPCMDDKDIFKRVYAIRKSINKKYFSSEE